MMNSSTLIISMTSWTRRIATAGFAIWSIWRQIKDSNAILVLVLAKTEFPNGLIDLPVEIQAMRSAGIIQIIWCDKNLYSHKKLMPTLMLYPENPILVVDDDIVRPDGWLDIFIKDHKEHPRDIIVGGCLFDVGFINGEFNPVLHHRFDMPSEASTIITNRRPANGFGGVLYPAHSFNDPRFYDIDLMMKLSSYSDESWQYCFNVMERRTLRHTSTIIAHQDGLMDGIYETSMSKLRDNDKNNSYVEIYRRLMTYFPEFKIQLSELLERKTI